MIKVLYVDDEPDLLVLGREFLEMTGDFQVCLQESAPAALDLLRTVHFDAIISDYQMPGMDGLEFLRQVRQEHGQIPFILFTGRGREEVVILALNSGADFYLQKGGEPRSQFAELAHKIRQAVHRWNADLALEESERRYREVVETQTEFICRFRPDGTHLFVNDAYCRYFGRKRGEIIGHVFIPQVPNGDRELVRAHFASLTPDHPTAELEHRVIMPDGSMRWHWWSDRAIFDAAGSLVGYQSAGRDITESRQAEEALRESEEKFRVLAETIPVSIIVFQGNHDVYVNDYTTRVTGRSKEELTTMNFWDGIHPDCQELLKERGLARLRGEDVPNQYEVKYLTKSGDVRWADISVGKIAFGGTMAGLATLVDITDRKRIEDALKQSEKDYRSIIENIQDAFYRTDENGNLVMISPSFARQFGFSDVTEVIGKNIRDTFYFDPSDRDRFLAMVRKEGHVEGFRITLKRRDGSPMVISASSHVYYAASGGFGGIEGILHDITDRVNAESALRDSEYNYRGLLESVPHIVFEMDAGFRITYANRCARETVGYPAEEIKRGIDAFRLVDPLQHDRLRGCMEQASQAGMARLGEFRIVRRDGTVFLALVVLDILRKNQRPDGYRGILIDLSARKSEPGLHGCPEMVPARDNAPVKEQD